MAAKVTTTAKIFAFASSPPTAYWEDGQIVVKTGFGGRWDATYDAPTVTISTMGSEDITAEVTASGGEIRTFTNTIELAANDACSERQTAMAAAALGVFIMLQSQE